MLRFKLALSLYSTAMLFAILSPPFGAVYGYTMDDLIPVCQAIKDARGVCTLSEVEFVHTSDYVWENTELLGFTGIVLEFSKFECRDRTTRQPCKLSFKFSKAGAFRFELADSSQIVGSEVYIYAASDETQVDLVIDGSSRITTSGKSRNSHGTAASRLQGASYVGEGGYCSGARGDPEAEGGASFEMLRYGSFNMLPDSANLLRDRDGNLTGSMGEASDSSGKTAGGGRIHIEVDRLVLRGEGQQIQANGYPRQETRPDHALDQTGGSGGYIYIKTAQSRAEDDDPLDNEIDPGATIAAFGGYGKNFGVGGAGGVIVADVLDDFNLDVSAMDAHGGLAGDGWIHNETYQLKCGTAAAGTVYLQDDFGSDHLDVHNAYQASDRFTVVSAAEHRDQSSYFREWAVADAVTVGSMANLKIENDQLWNITFPTLAVASESTLKFALGNTRLRVKAREHFQMGPTATLDFQSVDFLTRIEFVPERWSTSLRVMELGTILFKRRLYVDDVPQIIFHGDVNDTHTEPADDLYGYMAFTAGDITVGPGARLKTDKIFMFANNSIDVGPGAKLLSTIEHECVESASQPLPSRDEEKLYDCMGSDLHEKTPMTYKYVLARFNTFYNLTEADTEYYARELTGGSRYQELVSDRWNVYLLSLGFIKTNGSTIAAPRVSMCSNFLELYEDSRIDANFRGCPADRGMGNLPLQPDSSCSGAGGAHAGKGGSGGGLGQGASEDDHCPSEYPHAYYKGPDAHSEGSGGTSGDAAGTTGGSGGGIIWLATPKTLILKDSSVGADGRWGQLDDYEQHGSGGGAGGSVQVLTQNLMGNGVISAKGGFGSARGGGGGSGGRFAMRYLRSYLNTSYPDQSYWWKGTHDVAGGRGGAYQNALVPPGDGQNGTVVAPKCFPGFAGVFCRPCAVGTYKYDYSYAECTPCTNKPPLSYYTTMAESRSVCRYECDVGIERAETNPDCDHALALEYERLGGAIPFFIMMVAFLLMSLLMFGMISCRKQIIDEEIKELGDTLYTVWEEQDEIGRGRTREDDYSLIDQAIFGHTHRLYLIGSNSVRNAWFIPQDFPRDALEKADREKLLEFIETYNPKLQWDCFERFTFACVSVLYPPVAKFYHSFIRSQKFKRLQIALYQAFPPQFWSDKGDNKTLRLGCSTHDHIMAYIDFLDFSKNKNTWLGLKLPMPLLLAGRGTFNNPYFLDFKQDTYAKSLVLIKFEFFKDKLPIFLENFNTQLSKLSFYKLQAQVTRDLYKTVQWVERANKIMFNHYNIKCILYIVENQYSEVDEGVFRQKRRSFPLETVFFDAFPVMYQNMLAYVKARITSGKSEIRLALVFKKFSRSKQIGTHLRVNMMKGAGQKAAYQQAVRREESVLFDETDSDQVDSKVTFAGKDKEKENQYLQGTSTTLTSEAQFSNDASQQIRPIKLVDKSRRAFSISIDSSKAFELAIRKPRRKAKHHLNKCRTCIYGTYLLFTKHHGSPPASKDLNSFFILYACILAIDILLLVGFTYHCFSPSAHFQSFGWAFMFLHFGVPFFAPLCAILSVCLGSQAMMKTSGNLNSMMILFNIPVTIFLLIINDDDLIYILQLCVMLVFKFALSAVGAVIRQFLLNPRYSKNRGKIAKLQQRQYLKLEERDRVFGRETARQIDALTDDNVLTKKMLAGYAPSDELPANELENVPINPDQMRDELLRSCDAQM